MKTTLLYAILPFFFFLSCTSNTKESNSNNQAETPPIISNNWSDNYKAIEATDIPDNVIKLINDDWMLVTAGNSDSYNAMTASWGAMGNIWEKPASFIFIRDTRYTYEFLQRETSFTLSFFTDDYRKALTLFGTKSGRDTDKVKESGLTPIATPSGLRTFGEARLVIECKKMFVEPLNPELITEEYKSEFMKSWYEKEPANHVLFISEITNVWIRK